MTKKDIKDIKNWDWQTLNQDLISHLLIEVDESSFKDGQDKEQIVEIVYSLAMNYYTEKEQLIPLELLRKLEKFIVLRTIDEKWIPKV